MLMIGPSSRASREFRGDSPGVPVFWVWSVTVKTSVGKGRLAVIELGKGVHGARQ